MDIKICDIHMHVVFGYDDGAERLQTSIDMLKIAYKQGVRRIYCTSHNGTKKKDVNLYLANFAKLKRLAKGYFPDLELFTGCEVLCAKEYIDVIPVGLACGIFLPLGKSKCVLTEFYPDVTPEEARLIINTLTKNGWKPIIAHIERYPYLFVGRTIEGLINRGALVQINLYSLVEDEDGKRRSYARKLIKKKQVHFIGSDAHSVNRRPPRYESGIKYLINNCDADYVEEICFGNAEKYIGV